MLQRITRLLVFSLPSLWLAATGIAQDAFWIPELRGGDKPDWYAPIEMDGQPNGQREVEIPDIPEPMVFDLVRPLGARKGELEVNTLAIFPFRAVNRDPTTDPFGSAQTIRDRGGIEWAPEIEYAFADGWAIEYEAPFEGSVMEAYKVALQGTFGTAFNNQFIHGFQTIVEPTRRWENWNSTLLYLAGIQFDDRWSALLMAGCRMDLEGSNNFKTFERLFNASLFRRYTDRLVFGLEVNHAVGRAGFSQTLLVPQMHYEIGRHLELQSGLGMGAFDEGYEQSFIMRLITTR